MGSLSLCLTFSFIFLLTGNFIHSCNAKRALCLESDREALLDFKSGLEDPENRLSSWNGSNCCQWKGIVCDNRTGAVIAIDLRNPNPPSLYSPGIGNLGGNITPSLVKLKFLRHLDLSFNSFSDIPFPKFLHCLRELRYLNLSNVGFRGNIPPILGNLTSLECLDLSSSWPSATVDNLDWVTNLVALKHLSLNQVALSGVGSSWVWALSKLPLLTELSLSSCFLSEYASSFTFVNFTSLAILDLSFNNMLLSKFPNWIANISSLVSLDISFSFFVGRIPLGLSNLPNLKSLVLAGNHLTAACPELFQGKWERIEVLDLSYNNLHGKLPASIGNMTSLTDLDLFGNRKIGGSIPSSIGRLCNLTLLDLSGNNLTGTFPDDFEGDNECFSDGPLPSLLYLLLSNNKLMGTLPKWLGQLSNLVELNLMSNFLHGPIPASLCRLQLLAIFQLAKNKLNGTLPDCLSQLSKLRVLDVSFNSFVGNITEAVLSNLRNLKKLHLSHNSFILDVSSNWVPPFQIRNLGMGSCNLGTSFPAWLKSQKEVTFLDFSNASISDSIPDWFWDISGTLSFLNMSFNYLHGELPNPLSIAPFATIDLRSNLFEGLIPIPNTDTTLLDFSNNQFSGSIPRKIGKLTRLRFLSLSHNKLVGRIPASVRQMRSLGVIDLSWNNLSGSIHPAVGNCTSLVALDLRNNKLSGTIPGSLGELYYLQILHLSNNNLSGELPSSFLHLKSLETLDVGNSSLTGNVPSWIGKGLRKLKILCLRSNAFFGELPPDLLNSSSLQILDLAENKLNGTIPATLGSLRAMAQVRKLKGYPFYGKEKGAYYEESIVVHTKNLSLPYTKILPLLNCIDLSGNMLNGEIPKEITKLVGLVVLNMSRNYINGEIPSNISELSQLSSLDLSNNKFSGPIPPSMSSLVGLGYLNLSNNNFSGRIPYTGQMATFGASAFAGNDGLCGAPLDDLCTFPYENSGNADPPDQYSADTLVDNWLGFSIGLGFATGILVPYIILAIRRPWSCAYFTFVEKAADRLLYLGCKMIVHFRKYCNRGK